eukprot:27248-Rhodomonas_salina.1
MTEQIGEARYENEGLLQSQLGSEGHATMLDLLYDFSSMEAHHVAQLQLADLVNIAGKTFTTAQEDVLEA